MSSADRLRCVLGALGAVREHDRDRLAHIAHDTVGDAPAAHKA